MGEEGRREGRAPATRLFIRTGVWARRKAHGPWLRGRVGKAAGLDASVHPVAEDSATSRCSAAIIRRTWRRRTALRPVHDFTLVYLGVHLLDNCDLEALAEAAAARKRWEFLLTAAPLPIRGGTGSPLNPIATF